MIRLFKTYVILSSMYTCFKLLCATMEMREVLSENESQKFLNRIILVAGALSGLLRSLGT